MYFRVHGGLGNLLIQIAFARKLAKTENLAIKIYSSLRSNLNAHEKSAIDLIESFSIATSGTSLVSYNHMINYCFKIFSFLKRKIGLKSFVYNNEVWYGINGKPYIIFEGYCQSSAHWPNGICEIWAFLSDFTEHYDFCRQGLNDKVVIHIRGGDYLNFDKNSLTNNEVYVSFLKKALTHLPPNLPITIVTDDKLYATSIINNLFPFIHINLFQIISSDVIIDFQEMATARYLITSNSTFSVMAGGLVHLKGGLVISPRSHMPSQANNLSFAKLPWVEIDS